MIVSMKTGHNPLLLLTVIVLLGLIGPISCSKKAAENTLLVENAFIKKMPPGQSAAAVYLTLQNTTGRPQELGYVYSPIAEHVALHRNFYEQGKMVMRPVKHLTVDPYEKLVFDPGGYHLMVFGLYNDLAVGESFELIMEFRSGEVKTVQVVVRRHG
ncbi:MAG: copper(I)-binding protein [Lentisphaeria bacterium]|jgi:copper(I)-binding protein